MRITNSMMTNNTLRDLNNNKAQMEIYGRQMSSLQRINRLEDDPAGLIVGLQSKMAQARTQNYLDGVRDVRTLVEASEDSILSINEAIKKALELTTQAATDAKTPADRQLIAQEIKQLRDQVLEDANAKINGKYIFAGYNTTERPFGTREVTINDTITIDQLVGDEWVPTSVAVTRNISMMTYNGELMDEAYRSTTAFSEELGQHVELEVGPDGTFFRTGFNGIELMDTGDKNLYNILSKLYDTLTHSDTIDGKEVGCSAKDVIPDAGVASRANPDGIHFIDALQGLQKQYLVLEADIGGRSNRLDLMESRYGLQALAYKEQESIVMDADMAEAATMFKMKEAMYTAALQATAKIIQPSLMDYLR